MSGNIFAYQCRTKKFKSPFFPWAIVELNKSDSKIQNLNSSAFKENFDQEN